MTLDAMEVLVAGQGRELLRGLVQLGLDAQAEREVRLPQVTGADGVRRARAERGHARPVVTRLGEVVVRRIGYRSGVKGRGVAVPARCGAEPAAAGVFLGSAAAGGDVLPGPVSYEQAHEFVLAATGVSIGKRQLEQIIVAAAADAERFCQDRVRDQAGPAAGAGEDEGACRRWRSRRTARAWRCAPRRAAAAPGPRSSGCGPSKAGRDRGEERLQADGRDRLRLRRRRPGRPAAHPGAGHAPGPRQPAAKKPPRAENRWYTCDITAGRDVTIGKVFDEADRRDPGHARTWIALVDGDNHQLGLIQAQAAARGITLAILVDFIHVLEYLWKAAWCFHPPRDPAMEDWVTAQGLDILHGRAAEVIARIAQLAAEHPPRPGGEHAKIIRKTLSYLENKQPYLDYPRALANGWPIATGVIEGACRHLVADRMGITGARWGLRRSPGHALAPRHQRQRRHRRLLGPGTSPRNTSATTSAATRTASASPPDPHSRRATPM